ncbi:TDT family transporter [Microbacterium aquimaris]|uniref:TDT family transporter n=1 Tax=Microbacterium aquimaris TaxID=459816 RepID=UPI002AD226D4|nr:TDT family transporter [Microbacterium aquimaris]MDZ8274901.1 TDT family transporter [Microbacterium aquimaris]
MTVLHTTPTTVPAPRRLLRALPRRRDALAHLTPNWYASIMGTGIVANAAVTLPVEVSWLRVPATAVWLLAAGLLVALTVATVAHAVLHPETARGHVRHPVMAHFTGAPPMAVLTVGAGTVLLGAPLLGERTAVMIGGALWVVGTVLGLVSAVVVPSLTFTRFQTRPDSVFGGWLMPVVPLMVSAATGAALVPFVPAGQPRETMLWLCYALFGVALMPSLIIVTLLWSRLAQQKVGAPGMVPTLWIVLGPLGQSVTAANLLARVAPTAVDEPTAAALHAAGLIYGIPVIGFAGLWAAVALAITLRTVREGLPFSLTWWSFTFPVGTCVTGLSALAVATGLTAVAMTAVVGFAALVAAWGIVAFRTFRGSVVHGTLFLPPA